ncbi:MAG TPA: AAA family ATPase, partial [Kineosporiaceae bacterium]|nr:AAA family ATPase [Kineosporiaceae bacterium]
MPDEPDPVLTAERTYLDSARTDLARMRERTRSLEVQGGDALSSEFLAATLWRRAHALADDPSTSLFFGRTDHDNGERWYVGRRHVADVHGDPVVIDWRAEVARAFYRASRTEPLGVVRRRRFGLEAGQITAYEDEHLRDASEHDGRSAILAREIERPRVGPMRDIVATIQPEQDEIVRSDADTTICIQGAPGTGKTAVGLHRAAWLLYAYRDRLGRSGVLVVGPNRSFLDHVSAVLPSLGEADVRHSTVEQLTGSVPVRGRDTVAVATLKGDPR